MNIFRFKETSEGIFNTLKTANFLYQTVKGAKYAYSFFSPAQAATAVIAGGASGGIVSTTLLALTITDVIISYGKLLLTDEIIYQLGLPLDNKFSTEELKLEWVRDLNDSINLNMDIPYVITEKLHKKLSEIQNKSLTNESFTEKTFTELQYIIVQKLLKVDPNFLAYTLLIQLASAPETVLEFLLLKLSEDQVHNILLPLKEHDFELAIKRLAELLNA